MIFHLLGVLWLSVLHPAPASVVHSEVVGEIRIDNFGTELFVDAVLDKRLLTSVLLKEGDCISAQMMEICGGNYFTDHVRFIVNGKPLKCSQQLLELHQEHVVYRFYLGDLNEKIKSVSVESDYMLHYNDHSVLKVKLGIDNELRTYNLHENLKKIEAKIP